MKVIFLDIDGVLINIESLHGNKAHPACVTALNHITGTSGAKIVVSSSWRKGGLVAVQYLLAGWGVMGTVIDITPDLSVEKTGYFVAPGRVNEIADWLLRNKEWTNYVILDDESMPPLWANLVKTNYITGLTMENAQEALKILRR